MDLVLAHRNMDFDALASQLAVTKLFPGTQMVPAHPLGDGIRSFLSLYRDALPIIDLQYVDWAKVQRVFIVDCQRLERLDERAQQAIAKHLDRLSITVFDHHQLDDTGLFPRASGDSIHKHVGAVSTILVELIEEKRIDISSFEATVLAAGIYEDTGCLTHPGTTAEDARAIAFLLSRGADLTRINQIIRPRFNTNQLDLFENLAEATHLVPVPAMRVTICTSATDTFVDGLADITSKLLGATSSDALISIVGMKDRVHIVCRSDNPHIDMADLAQRFGGAGHSGAASAVVKNSDIATLKTQIEKYILEHVKPEKTAQEIMTSPVRTIRSDLDMAEAGRIMLRHSLDGLVVMDNDQLTGIVSKRDVDKAHHHKLAHAPVRGFMGNPVITVSPETTISQMQKIMVKEDIGRLPVLDESQKLVGLVGRSEILTALYGASSARHIDEGIIHPHKHTEDVRERLEKADPEMVALFRELGTDAAQLDMRIFLVGGCVRDLLLRRQNADLDFVVEGQAISLAANLVERMPDRFQMIAIHERFGTAALEVKLNGGAREIDLATARTEFYEYPAALPTVEPSSLEQDLFRRDFTINALAINLHPKSFGQVEDYYDGMRDLESRSIRVLHPFSFIEDPTRIVRAAKFAARLGFTIDPKTQLQARRAIALGIFDNLGGVRLKDEIHAMLDADSRLDALEALDAMGGGMRFLDSSLSYSRALRLYVRRAQRLLRQYPLERAWIVYLGVILCELDSGRLTDTLNRLQLSEEDKRWIQESRVAFSSLEMLERNAARADVFHALNGFSDHSLAIAASLAPSGSAVRRLIRLYMDELRHIKPILRGTDLITMGVPQGPIVGNILRELHDQILNGDIASADKERAFVESAIKRHRQ